MPSNGIKVPGRVDLDSYDMAILSALSDNAELTTIELSKIVHLSRTAVARRVNNLSDSGVITPARIGINYDKLGFSVRAFVEFSAPDQDSFHVRDTLLNRPEVLDLSIVLGEHLIVAEVIAVDTKHLHHFLTLLNDLGVTETKVILQKHRPKLSFRERIEMIEREGENVDPRLQAVAEKS
jgi:DNA-binding Lrp family transcriptional regulator